MSGKWQRNGRRWEILNPADEQEITFSLDEFLPRGAKVTGVKLTYATNADYVAGDVSLELIAHDSVGDQSTSVHSSTTLAKSTTSLTPMKVALAVPTRLLMSDGKETMIRARYLNARPGAEFRLLGVNATYTYTNRPQPYPLSRLVAFAGALALSTQGTLPAIGGFDGTNYYSRDMATDGITITSNAYTWGALFRLSGSSTPTGSQFFGVSSLFGDGGLFSIDGQTLIGVCISDSGGRVFLPYAVPDTNKFHTAVLTVAGGTVGNAVNLYVDGVLRGTGALPTAATVFDSTVRVGAGPAEAYFAGGFHESRAYSAAEAAAWHGLVSQARAYRAPVNNVSGVPNSWLPPMSGDGSVSVDPHMRLLPILRYSTAVAGAGIARVGTGLLDLQSLTSEFA